MVGIGTNGHVRAGGRQIGGQRRITGTDDGDDGGYEGDQVFARPAPDARAIGQPGQQLSAAEAGARPAGQQDSGDA